MSKKMTKQQSIWFLANRRRKRRKTEKTGEESVPPIIPPKTSLEAYTWDELDMISTQDIAPNGLTDEQIRARYNFGVGDMKSFVIGQFTYHAQIIGVNHDDRADISRKAGLTFLLFEVYETLARMKMLNSNAGGWIDSEMRMVTLPAIKQLLPKDILSVIKTVVKFTANGGNQAGAAVVPANEDLFLPAVLEIAASSVNTHPGEGTQYSYWLEGFLEEKRFKIRAGTSDNTEWWMRSPRSTHASQWYSVSLSETGWSATPPNNPRGVSFAFCV